MDRRLARWSLPWRCSVPVRRRPNAIWQLFSNRACRAFHACRPRHSPGRRFTGAAQVSDEQLERAQIEIARAVVRRFDLSTDVLAFDTTNFDTHIATTTAGELARRGHAKEQTKRSARSRAGGSGQRDGARAAAAPHLPR